MGMGIVSDEEFAREQQSLERNVVPVNSSVVIKDISIGRPKGSTEVPEEVRSIIGEVGIVDRQGALSLAASLGISPSATSAYANGATSTASYHDKDNSTGKHVDRVRSRIVKRAKSRLLDALDSITEEKLQAAKLTESSSVARDMSTIIKNMEPEVSSVSNNTQNNFVLYRPMMKSEDSFETIYAKE